MRLRTLSIAGVLAIIASVAQAQTSTADVVEAFVRGRLSASGGDSAADR